MARNRRQYQLERALYKSGDPGGGHVGAAVDHDLQVGTDIPRIEAPKSHAPDPSQAHNLADRPSVDP